MPLDATGFDLSAVPPREDDTVRVIVLYDPFNPADRQFVDIVWDKDRTLAEYVGELEGNWLLVANGREIAREEWHTATALKDETMVLAQVPQGNGGGFFKIILMIAVVVLASYAAPALGAAAGGWLSSAAGVGLIKAVMIGAGAFLINAMMPDPKPPGREQESSSPSYGIDGPKSTSREEVPVPVVYGEFRVGGNRINVHTENSPDGLSQVLYAQYVVSEGPIESITDVEINSQSASVYQNVEIETRLGTLDQEAVGWFESAVTPYYDGRTISTTPILYTTRSDVDKIRLDVTFPNGLCAVDPGDGRRFLYAVDFEASARNIDTNVSYPIQTLAWVPTTLNGQNRTEHGGTHARVTVRARRTDVTTQTGFDGDGVPILSVDPNSGAYNFTLTIKSADGTVLHTVTESGIAPPPEWVYDNGADNGFNMWGQIVKNGRDFTYEVHGDGDPYFTVELTDNSGAYADVLMVSTEVFTVSGHLHVERREKNTVRVSMNSYPLPRGRYQVSIRRVLAESTGDYVSDKAILTDVNEIQTDRINYVRTANYAIRVRFTDQLNGEPNVTVKVRGRKVHVYDANGGHNGRVWSDNPADVALDILLSEDWERRFSATRIDFPAFVRWRQACAASGLKFNGIFDTTSNVWDALMTVCRVGRANLVVVGTKWSVVLEAPSEPVMMFGDHNIIAGSFKNEWFGRDGRANRIEAQYYDKTDRNKRKSVFALDETAIARGDAIRDASFNLVGVDNQEQAYHEAQFQLRLNQRIVQGCRFRSYLDAIGCLPGDVVLVQHTMPAWGWASRVKSVSGSTVVLESPLSPPGGPFEKGPDPQSFLADGDWRIMVMRSAVLRGTATITAASGSLITVEGVHTAEAFPEAPHVRRIIINGEDYRVLDVTFLTTHTVYALDRPSGVAPGATAQLWATEMLQQGSIARPHEWDESVTVTDWTNNAPIQAGDHILIGRTQTLGKKFRVKRFAYSNDQERELELIEYDPWVYEPDTYVPSGSASELQTTPLHVTGVAADTYARPLDNGSSRYYARVSWLAPLNDQMNHAGARVYVSRDFSDYALHEVVPLGRYDSEVAAEVGETIRFKVVAYTDRGTNAAFSTAPIASVLVRPNLVNPDPPTGLIGRAGPGQVSLYWTPPESGIIPAHYVVYMSSTGGVIADADPLGRTASPFYVASGLDGGSTYWFWVRSFSASGTSSVLCGPVSSTPTIPGLGENQFPIERVDALPTGLGPSDEGRLYYLTETDGIYPGGRLYRWTGSGWVVQINGVEDIPAGGISSEQIENVTAGQITGQLSQSHFSQSLRPIERVNAMPTTGNFQGRVVYLTANDSTSFPGTVFIANKLYRWTGTVWTAEVRSEDIDSRGLDIRDAFGNVVFGHDGQIDSSAYVNLNGNVVQISTIAANSLMPSLAYVGEFATPPTESQLGANWRQNAVYKNSTDGRSYVLTGTPLGWVVYLADGLSFSVVVESTNGTTFRVGQSQSTLLRARLFKNGAEVTDETPESWFRWRRVSAIPQAPPNDDATWNTAYVSGYKQVSINVDSVYARATFFCDIISP